MAQTTIIVREDENGETHILLEKGASQGTRNDQKIATHLVKMANQMIQPGAMAQARQLANHPLLKNFFNKQ